MSSGKLKYQIVKEWLQKEACKPESRHKMPTVREIRKLFSVSLAPVSRALQELEREGIIRCQQGSGIVALAPESNLNAPAPVGSNNQGTIVFAYTDYPTESIWQQEHIYGQMALQNKLDLACYRIYQRENFERLPQYLEGITDLRGVVICPTSGPLSFKVLEQLAKFNVPVVLNDSSCLYDLPDNMHVTRPDPIDRGQVTIKYLFEKGHRSIGVIRNEPTSNLIDEILQGMRIQAVELGLTKDSINVFSDTIRYWDNSMDAAQRLTFKSLPDIRKKGITALVYISTPGAFAAMQTLQSNGLSVPNDISTCGFAEYSFARYSYPSLTVCTCDYQQMAKDAFSMASGLQKITKVHTDYPHQIIERNSVADIAVADGGEVLSDSLLVNV